MSMVSCIECRSRLPQLFHAISPVLCTGDKQICQLNIVQRCRGSSEAQSCMKGRDESMKYKALFDGHLRNTSRPFRQSHYACVENECVKLHVQRIEGLLEGTSICMQGNKRLWHLYKSTTKVMGSDIEETAKKATFNPKCRSVTAWRGNMQLLGVLLKNSETCQPSNAPTSTRPNPWWESGRHRRGCWKNARVEHQNQTVKCFMGLDNASSPFEDSSLQNCCNFRSC